MAIADSTAFGGLLKKVYGSEVNNLVPDAAILTKEIPFRAAKRIGDSYNEAVSLAAEQGITYAGSDVDGVPYADPVPGTVKQASIKSTQLIGQMHIGFELASRAMTGGSEAAFKSALDLPVSNFALSMRNRQEINLWYGNKPIGVVGAVSGTTITISDAEWAAGIWTCLLNAKADLYVGSTAVVRISGVQITGMDLTAKTITLSAATAVAANDTIYLAGARGSESAGIHDIITTSGSLWGIDNTVYPAWKGNTYAVGGGLTQAKLDRAACLAMDKGFLGNRKLFVHPRVWSELLVEQTARRQFTSDSGTMSNGANTLRFKSQAGDIEVISSPFIKMGYGYLLNLDDFVRIGAVDFKLGDPAGKDSGVRALTNVTAYQVIGYANTSLFCRKPGNQTLLTGITVSA